jgi:hypothetical protein
MPFNTAKIGIELLMDVTNGLREIHDRMTARAFRAVCQATSAFGPPATRKLAHLGGCL